MLVFVKIDDRPKTATNKADTAVLGGCGCNRVAKRLQPLRNHTSIDGCCMLYYVNSWPCLLYGLY